MVIVLENADNQRNELNHYTTEQQENFPSHVHYISPPPIRSIEKGSNRRMPLCKESDFPNEGLRKQPPPFGYSEGIVGSPSILYHIWRILSICLRKNLDNPCKICYNTRTGNYRPGGRHPSQKTGKRSKQVTAYSAGTIITE